MYLIEGFTSKLWNIMPFRKQGSFTSNSYTALRATL